MSDDVKRGPGRPPKEERLSRAQQRARQIREERKGRRVALDGMDQKLEVHGKEDGFHYRWVNDEGTRIASLKERGYEFVASNEVIAASDEEGDNISQTVGTQKTNRPLKGFLMRIPSEIYEEDQKIRQRRVDEVDEAIKAGKVQPSTGDSSHQYVPVGPDGRSRIRIEEGTE